jgi:hypothetical protein
MSQITRNLTDAVDGFFAGKRYLIHDRDPLYTKDFLAILASSGIKSVKLPPRSPNLNAYAERFVRSIKEGCLEQMILFGEQSLRTAVREFVAHYHLERNHQGLDNHLIVRSEAAVLTKGIVRKCQRLGGILNYYYREAAMISVFGPYGTLFARDSNSREPAIAVLNSRRSLCSIGCH